MSGWQWPEAKADGSFLTEHGRTKPSQGRAGAQPWDPQAVLSPRLYRAELKVFQTDDFNVRIFLAFYFKSFFDACSPQCCSKLFIESLYNLPGLF